MRFGHFFYPMNFDASRDYQAIADCLAEAELVERLGFDAIWISEHHFAGEAVYGDALVFAAACPSIGRLTLGYCGARRSKGCLRRTR